MALKFNIVTVDKFTPSKVISNDLPLPAFSDSSKFVTSSDFDDFGFSVFSSNRTLQNSNDFSDKIKKSVLTQKDLSSLTAQEFSDYVELGITPKIKNNRDKAISSLTQVPEDVQNSQLSVTPNSNNLITLLSTLGKNSNDINSKLLDSFNHLGTLQHNQNKILLESNQIALEKNRILETQHHRDTAHQLIMSESSVLSSQMLGYLPALIEAMVTSSKNNIELQNVSNAHLYQKNVNDAYAFNYNKDDDNGTVKSLNNIATNLASSAKSHASIVQPIKNQGDLAVEEKKIVDEENSPEHKSFLQDVFDSLSGEIEDFNIFNWLIDNTTEVKK